MNRIHFTYLIIILVLTSCFGSNVLTYKTKTYFSEDNIISSDSTFKLIQRVCYNKPSVIDEEFCYELKITFLDTTVAKAKQTLDLQVDTNIVKVDYGIFSIWNWSNENNEVLGQIEITNWNCDKVTIRENMIVTDYRRKETKRFKGKRTFTRKEGW